MMHTAFGLFLFFFAAGAALQVRADGQRGPDNPTLQLSLTDPGPVGAETTTNIYFAQVAVGGGYNTVFTLMNTGSTAVNGTLFVTDSNGNPFNINLTEPSAPVSAGGQIDAVGSNFPVGPIAPGGTKFYTAAAVNSTDPVKNGWARVQNIGGSLNGVATFAVTSGGAITTIAGVLSSQLVNVATIPIEDNVNQNRFTGYAVANPGTSNITVKVVIVNDTGTVRIPDLNVRALNPLGGGMQVARFFFQDSIPAVFRGSAVLIGQGNAQFACVALVLQGSLFTAIPVIPEKPPTIN
jgi:hypothetical protein